MLISGGACRNAAKENGFCGIAAHQKKAHVDHAAPSGGSPVKVKSHKDTAGPSLEELGRMIIADLRATAKQHGIEIPASAKLKADIYDVVTRGLGYVACGEDHVVDSRTVRAARREDAPAPEELVRMTVADLRATAAQHGIELPTDIVLKNDILGHVARDLGYGRRQHAARANFSAAGGDDHP
jgi:hypothetical protein